MSDLRGCRGILLACVIGVLLWGCGGLALARLLAILIS